MLTPAAIFDPWFLEAHVTNWMMKPRKYRKVKTPVFKNSCNVRNYYSTH